MFCRGNGSLHEIGCARRLPAVSIARKMKTRSTTEPQVQPLRDRLKQATREAILEAAEAVFSERGFGGARVEEIAERAGVSVGTLYNYFDARRAILDAVLEASWRDLGEALRGDLLPETAP